MDNKVDNSIMAYHRAQMNRLALSDKRSSWEFQQHFKGWAEAHRARMAPASKSNTYEA